MLFIAIRADAVAELNIRMGGKVTFQLLPVILIIANFFAIRADGQKTLKHSDMRHGLFKFFHASCQCYLQHDHLAANLNSGP